MRDGVVVAGAGPAGLALALACASAGLDVTVVDPTPDRPWPATYGAWLDEVAGVDLPSAVWARVYDAPLVGVDGRPPIPTDRRYGLLDSPVLWEVLRDRAAAAGVRRRTGRLTGVAHDADGSRVRLADGAALVAGVVVDATGHRARLVRDGRGGGPVRRRGPGWQVAHGIVARVRDAPVPEGGMWFMDWRAPWGPAPGEPATFLYAMDLGGGRAFLEETSLAARPAVALPVLERRLARRLAAAGATVEAVEATERVAFPMGGGLPERPQRVVAFGAAAGMIHPATGYQVAAALRRAPAVAAALAGGLAAEGADPAAVAAAAWAAVWPDDLVRQRDLHLAGLEVLLALGPHDLPRFFAAFFELPPEDWRAYVSGAASSRELARVMAVLLRRLPPALARRVVTTSLRGGLRPLLRGALGT